MKRKPVSFKTDRRVFTRTADNVHSANFMFMRPTRGGYRM